MKEVRSENLLPTNKEESEKEHKKHPLYAIKRIFMNLDILAYVVIAVSIIVVIATKNPLFFIGLGFATVLLINDTIAKKICDVAYYYLQYKGIKTYIDTKKDGEKRKSKYTTQL